MQQQKKFEWLAYCVPCRRVIERAPNGAIVEAAAKRHVKEMPHTFEGPADVIVGYNIRQVIEREEAEKEGLEFVGKCRDVAWRRGVK